MKVTIDYTSSVSIARAAAATASNPTRGPSTVGQRRGFYAFPQDAIAAEAPPSTEMALIADLDLDKLDELQRSGSVRNLKDRRLDLYHLGWKREQD